MECAGEVTKLSCHPQTAFRSCSVLSSCSSITTNINPAGFSKWISMDIPKYLYKVHVVYACHKSAESALPITFLYFFFPLYPTVEWRCLITTTNKKVTSWDIILGWDKQLFTPNRLYWLGIRVNILKIVTYHHFRLCGASCCFSSCSAMAMGQSAFLTTITLNIKI